MDILIIQVLRMGDALQLVPIIKEIKEVFPASRISLLTSTLGAGIFKNLTEVEAVFTLEKETISTLITRGEKEDLISALEKLKENLTTVMNRKWDWVINLNYTFGSALLSYVLDTRHRSGFAANKYRQYISKDKWFPFSLASFMNRKYSNFNWVDIYKQSIGLRSVPQGPYFLPESSNVSKAVSKIRNIGFENQKIIGMHPGAGGDFKQWPIEKFGQLGKMLVEQNDTRILIFGDQKESMSGEHLKTFIGESAANLAGQTTLEELAAFLSKCDVLITNDTGPMHLASAVGTRVIALFFSTHFVETGPYGAGHIAIHPNIPCFPCQGTAQCRRKVCLDQISVEAVKKTVNIGKPLLKKSNFNVDVRNSDHIGMFLSGFDPWGNLDWLPIGSHRLTSQTLEKLMIKAAWLNYSNVLDSSDASLDDYIKTIIQYYDTSSPNGNVEAFLSNFSGQLMEFRALLDKAKGLSFELQSEFINGLENRESIQRLSEMLTDTEEEISSFGEDTAFSFLSELLSTLLENIEKTDRLNLSTRTVEVYRDLTFLVNIMLKHSESLNGYLN